MEPLETLQMLVSTDNHLGYADKNPIRGMDSFAAFEEMLLVAKEREVDLVVLAGDLFHENKPSRPTLHKAMTLLREHALGDRAVEFEVVSDQKKNFGSSVNYENPFVSVGLPIFSIHGNHDDPTRDGGFEALAALDVLSAANVVNYFGQQAKVDNIEISPVLLRKGGVHVALYGLGHVRDERLNRAWTDKKVKFLRPRDDGNNKYYSIFILHQNRDAGRGLKACVHEDMIPQWIDLVVWGHEHECRVEPRMSTVGTFRVTQPGSTVATSLIEGEARRKSVCVVQVGSFEALERGEPRQQKVRIEPIPLTMVRPFVIGEIVLSDHLAEETTDDKQVAALLGTKVEAMIDEAIRDREEPRFPDQRFKLNHPNQVLVRLRVDHTGFEQVSAQRFGGQFVGKAANPTEILHYARASKKKTTAKGKADRSGLDAPTEENPIDTVRVEDLVQSLLDGSVKKLELLEENKLNDALLDYVDKQETNAFNELVDKRLRNVKKKYQKEKLDDESGEPEDYRTRIARETREANERSKAARRGEEDDDDDTPSNSPRAAAGSKKKATKRRDDDDDDNDDDMEDDEPPPPKSSSRGRAPAKKTAAKRRKADDESDDEDEEEEDEPPAPAKSSRGRAPAKKPAAAAKRRKADDESDDEDEEEEEDEPPAPAKSSRGRAPAKKPAAAAKRRKADDESDDEEEDEPPPKARGRPAAKKPAAKKRGRRDEEDSGDEDHEPGAAPTPRRSGRGRKQVKYAPEDDEIDEIEDDEDEEAAPPKKKKRSTAAKSKLVDLTLED
ncbi:hypothetical protein CTAYLR_004216 [Chrysophaeum taylorii]|uniref:Double-strand break repair protein n=1 Tax=Chrysophaeum taylorii TaxID=2483200 RepID=A0AAD7UDA4_9STRA|nr:hypothetical protein CTAYLR_004216 [Chrysophaeum taylorii]